MHDVKVFLVCSGLLVAYVLIVLAFPMPKCIRCHGKRVLQPKPSKKTRRPRKGRKCWYCRGHGHAPLPGGQVIHHFYHRVMRDRIKAQRKADVERRLTKMGHGDGK